MKRVLIIAGLVIFFLALLVFVISYNASYSEGFRAGTIVKISTKGTMFKTREGQLHIGGLSGANEGDLASGLWDFSIEKADTAVYSALLKAQDFGYRVKLHYTQKYFTFFWRGDTEYFVDEVKVVGKGKKEAE